MQISVPVHNPPFKQFELHEKILLQSEPVKPNEHEQIFVPIQVPPFSHVGSHEYAVAQVGPNLILCYVYRNI